MTILTDMAHWTLGDIPWEKFDRSKVDPEIVRIVKAASLVEQNGGDYTEYLCGVFRDDPAFIEVARRWGGEEIQHGQALGHWAMLADPTWDHAKAAARFTAGFRVDIHATESLRGTRAGELVSRCIVETGTSSYYSALAEATEEPVLRAICRRIAADEIRHYKLFHRHLEHYAALERLGLWPRLRVALGRIREAEDDELAFAYHVANGAGPYDRRAAVRAYGAAAARLYRRHHAAQLVRLTLKAVGLARGGALERMAEMLAWRMLKRQARLAVLP